MERALRYITTSKRKVKFRPHVVLNICNPSYSGGRDQAQADPRQKA
jgi:hypothetical protein